jgi:hypothetical protein
MGLGRILSEMGHVEDFMGNKNVLHHFAMVILIHMLAQNYWIVHFAVYKLYISIFNILKTLIHKNT